MANFDDLETRNMTIRKADQLSQLQAQISHAQKNCSYYTDLKNVDSLTDLSKLPITRKSDLADLQTNQNPFAGLNAIPVQQMKNLFLSPGPIAEPMGQAANEHRLARAMNAANISNQDRVLNCFSYHHTPAGLMFESAAINLGCPVYPGGIGQRDDQIKAITHFMLTAYVGTPDFLKLIVEKAQELKVDISSLNKALVTGGPFFPALKEFYKAQNIAVKECYATADVGLIAYQDDEIGLVIDEDVIVEIVTPGTGNVVADGEVGEVVVTLLTNQTYPLIRFATGDLSAFIAENISTNRTNKRLKGWMGRADQTCKIKGMFVHPKQVAQIIVTSGNISKARLVVDNVQGQDQATLICETSANFDITQVTEIVKNITKISVKVELTKPNSLPNDGIIIEDKRDYS
ncbi:MAG: AMP-binding protein [Rhizobiales bacterium]|nr:AMP-binding protein [Hyphomicrobiales bacterium]